MPRPKTYDPARVELELMHMLEDYASRGERCPTATMFAERVAGDVRRALHRLQYRGRIRVQVFGHNYRVVTILTGPLAGKQTKPAPRGWVEQTSSIERNEHIAQYVKSHGVR